MTVDLNALEAVLAKATPGKWEWLPKANKLTRSRNPSYRYPMGAFYSGRTLLAWFGDRETYYPTEGTPFNNDDTAAIVVLHNAAPALIAEHRALLARVEELEAEVARLCIEDLDGVLASELVGLTRAALEPKP